LPSLALACQSEDLSVRGSRNPKLSEPTRPSPDDRKRGSGAVGVLTKIGTLTARPWSFLILLAYAGAWLIVDRHSLNWHGAATLATWAMTLFIQRSEHRDTLALQAKLDELLRASGSARNELTKIDEQEPEEIERHRDAERR
jgi:low affinity Fe/Cu permease